MTEAAVAAAGPGPRDQILAIFDAVYQQIGSGQFRGCAMMMTLAEFLTWLYLQAQITLLAIEIDVVRARALWPRSLFPPLTPQDMAAYRLYAQVEQRRRGIDIEVDDRAVAASAATEPAPAGPSNPAGSVNQESECRSWP